MNDVSSALMAKSDQLNADDLLGGSIVIEITKVTNLGKGKEQPLILNYKDDDGKPWKPCKSMGRVLVHAWKTTDGNKWIGRKVRLYRDDKVRQPDGTVGGGTRIAHKDSLSHIDKPMDIVIAVSRGKKAPYHVEPMIEAQAAKPVDAGNDEALKTAGRKEAEKGTVALRAWWMPLGGATHQRLGESFLAELKASAGKADAAHSAPMSLPEPEESYNGGDVDFDS